MKTPTTDDTGYVTPGISNDQYITDVCCSLRCERDDLADKILSLTDEIKRLHEDCRKYRVALNRVAYPDIWDVNPGYHVEIARRALVIGVWVDPLPKGAEHKNP